MTALKQKGDRGEALVRLMFEWHGCQVLEFGVEKHFPQLLHNSVKLHKSALGTSAIRSLPDFLVMRETLEGLLPTYIEVKTHKSAPAVSSIRHYEMHGAVCVIWVGPEGIRYTWVIRGQEAGPFKPIEKLGVLEADAALMEPIHDLARMLHQERYTPAAVSREKTSRAANVAEGGMATVAKKPAATAASRAKYFAKLNKNR